MIALYARVSTDDKDQDPETQLYALRHWAADNGWPEWNIREYVDRAEATDYRGRKAWNQLIKDARAGRETVIAVLRLDRAFR